MSKKNDNKLEQVEQLEEVKQVEQLEEVKQVEQLEEGKKQNTVKKVYFSLATKTVISSFEIINNKKQPTIYEFKNPEKNIFCVQETNFNKLMKLKIFKNIVRPVIVIEL